MQTQAPTRQTERVHRMPALRPCRYALCAIVPVATALLVGASPAQAQSLIPAGPASRPGWAIFLPVLGFKLLGDGPRDALDAWQI